MGSVDYLLGILSHMRVRSEMDAVTQWHLVPADLFNVYTLRKHVISWSQCRRSQPIFIFIDTVTKRSCPDASLS